jgi:hypothetical protein
MENINQTELSVITKYLKKDIKASTASWQGQLKHGNTGGLQLRLLKPLHDIINQSNKNTTNDNKGN